ncbi:xyloglucan galactosyltransferase KATAMARI1-like protein [Iris pallida]|uniref:Xyloglucan galactosyltransferase KATAMARI1-like protein n=1 Tax=Iris pallida TaxID=29817 RepID=A0AAX6E3F8_IRIPA|nr:xyloglucan galactosyltransferase KATAMARI1-like protein [Iris pallida]
MPCPIRIRNLQHDLQLSQPKLNMNKSLGKRSGGGSRNIVPLCWLLAASSCFWLLMFTPIPLHRLAGMCSMSTPTTTITDQCEGRYIYVHDLPARFNADMIHNCRNLSPWTDMCRFTSNAGLGPKLDDSEGVFSETGWYATNQFALDYIFHQRIQRYECLTGDSSLASAVFVPFYAGFDIGKHLWGYNTSVRDSAGLELVKWLTERPEWARMGGRDHFMVAGRITWDFRRLTEDGDWGSKLLLLPEVKNMTVLVIESSPWHGNDFGVPYPTYFHPSSASEIVSWQERMRKLKRPWLSSFAGAPRPNQTESIRGQLMEQCRPSEKCKLLECDFGASKCHSPSSVVHMFQESVFCLQPQGDSYTRRSTFDSMLAGCIPVFFHPGSAYVQYLWHLPKNYTKYSVFISEDDVREGTAKVGEVLKRFSEEEVRRMREEVIGMIPSLVYRDPRESRMEGVKDAFDVAVEGVFERVERLRRGVPLEEMEEESSSWKYGLFGRGGEHEWDHFFRTPKR